MEQKLNVLERLSQHEKLTIRVSSNTSAPIPADIYRQLIKPHRKTSYFFMFVEKGCTQHSVDLKKIEVKSGSLLFVLPHQIHLLPPKSTEIKYFKLSISEECLTLLPRRFLFLINPLNTQLIFPGGDACRRIKKTFEILQDLLRQRENTVDLVLAYLGALLEEINQAYFADTVYDNKTDGKLTTFIAFKSIVERDLLKHPTIHDLAAEMGLNSNSLYYLVKTYTGLSPKSFIMNRLILEAKRKLYYSETSIKELAYDLGFSDPDYFSRLFKKRTGKAVKEFEKYLQDLSGN